MTLMFSSVLETVETSSFPTLSQTKWYVVTGNESDQRRENVDEILTKVDSENATMDLMRPASRCCVLNASASAQHTTTEAGKSSKIGHWCSFLTFLQRIGTQGVGVWIEDDVVLQSWKDVDSIQNAVSQASNAKPLQRFSHADGLLVVRNDVVAAERGESRIQPIYCTRNWGSMT